MGAINLLGLLVSLIAWLMTTTPPAAGEQPKVTFTDVASQAGLNFVNVSGGLKTKKYLGRAQAPVDTRCSVPQYGGVS